MGQAKSVAVAFIGKLKTVAQMVAIPLLLFHDPLLGAVDCQWLGTILINVAAVLTVVSMLYYLRKALPHYAVRYAGLTYNSRLDAGVAQLVERNLAKVEVASSRLVSRSRLRKGRSGRLSRPSLFVSIWRDGRVVMQRPAKPCTPVRFRLPPPSPRVRPPGWRNW